MKKTLIALAAVAVSGAAFAQNVTMYGAMDVGVVNSAAGTKLTTGLAATPRLGVRGTEDLGGGLSASFVLETSFSNTAAAETKLGDRGAHVSLTGGFGTVNLGAGILSPSFYAGAATEATGAANYAKGVYGAGARNNSSINYSIKVADVTVRAATILKDDAAGDKALYDLSAVYAAGALTLAASTSNNNASDVKGSLIGAAYDLGVAKVFFNQAKKSGEQATQTMGVSAAVGAATVQFGYRNAKATGVKGNVLAAVYPLSKRTSVTAFTSKDKGAKASTGVGILHGF